MGLLNVLGLVSAQRFAAVSDRLRKSESRAEALSRKLEDAQADARTWRSKSDEAQKRVKELESETARGAQRVEKAVERATEKTRAELEKQAARKKVKTIDADALGTRLDDAERDLSVARDHLMAIEVKLDILEGAATVLDGRTRRVLSERPAGGAGVPA